MIDFLTQIPKELINFLLVLSISFLIGIEQRNLHIDLKFESLYGTDRTFTLIGILGFILYILAPVSLLFFFAGGAVLSVLLGIYYYNKIKINNQWGFTSIIIALITYCITPLVYLKPAWMVMLIVVTILIVVEIKQTLFNFSKKIDRTEFTTLARFIIIAGIILPLLPNTPILHGYSISPFQIWLSIVAVSGISYFSYLLKKFVFPDSGIILSAILGGLYSSTATTIILAKKSCEGDDPVKVTIGIFSATGMMYLRILILAGIFNQEAALILLPYFLGYSILCFVIITILKLKHKPDLGESVQVNKVQNPLEFKTALLFGLLFSLFILLTNFVVSNYGNIGVNLLSMIVGITDIDPFILNLFQRSSGNININTIVVATIIASASNNLIKMIYSVVLGDKTIKKNVIIGFSFLIVFSLITAFFIGR
jgi:uncharacterized membrane protein (DUF4010 family)